MIGIHRLFGIFLMGAAPMVFAWTGKAQDKNVPPEMDYAAQLSRLPAKEPREALSTFKLAPGFRIELAACEPAIRSPVAVDFDADGRMYVAEFPEYNQQGKPNVKERGAIKLLEDTKGTGVYDKVTVFAADIDSPVALACWDGGLFVGAVPNIYYLKDTDGDGKADLKKIVYTGFARDKAGEGMLNSFRWGLDNRLHISTSQAGGSVKQAEAKDAREFNVRGQGFLFDPRSFKFELVPVGGQHGMSMDDWGRKFACDNSNPGLLWMYDGRYLRSNPYVQAPPPLVNIHGVNQANYLKRLSPMEPWRVLRTRLRLEGTVPGPTETGQPAGHFTGTTGVTIYRGDAFPPEYRGTLFVGEVANNLVFHARLEPKGLSLTMHRFEKDMEFLASTDTWFRPAQFANAPDGTLYVIDHYRELIETTESIPPVILKHLHPEAGIDRGRIYRIVPEGFKRPPLPQLSKADTGGLVKLLEHPNGWHRDTAARLLYERQDRKAVEPMKAMARKSTSALGRLHALYALAGLNALAETDLRAALGDEEPRVRAHALKLAEPFLAERKLFDKVQAAGSDPDPGVRYQLAFTLGAAQFPEVAQALHQLALRDGKDPWMRLAILTSAHGRRGELFRLLTGTDKLRQSAEGKMMVNALAVQIGAANQDGDLTVFLKVMEGLPASEATLSRELVASLMTRLPAQARMRITGAGKTSELFKEFVVNALKTAGDDKRGVAQRVAAIRILGLAEFALVKPVMVDLLKFRQPEAVQKAALETLARFENTEPAELVIAAWPELSPQVRATAAETLFARTAWVDAFLGAVEKGRIKPGDIDPARLKLLRVAADAKTRTRLEKLFQGTQLSGRKDVVAAYQKALELKGDAGKGKAIFKKNCASCHRLEGVGEQIGAELTGIKDRSADFLLLNILDPNREVLPRFITYVVVTDAGVTATGMITAETSTGITLRRLDGTNATFLRVNIDQFRSTGMSFMPEGLEKQINPQEMADLLAYLLTAK